MFTSYGDTTAKIGRNATAAQDVPLSHKSAAERDVDKNQRFAMKRGDNHWQTFRICNLVRVAEQWHSSSNCFLGESEQTIDGWIMYI